MNPAPAWHPDDQSLGTYVDGTAATVTAASIEAHVLSCSRCRAAVTPGVPAARLTAVRDRIDDELDAQQRPWLERVLRRCGVREDDARVLLAAPSMRLAWWAAVAAALGLTGVAAHGDENAIGLFLLIAPLLPALGTAGAYAPRLDPAIAIVAATPYRAVRLLLVRTSVVSGVSFLLAAAAAAALPGAGWTTAAWVLPALGLTLGVLALSTWLDVGVAAAVGCGAWITAVLFTAQRTSDPLAAFQVPGQALSAGVAALAVAVLVHHRDRLDLGSPA